MFKYNGFFMHKSFHIDLQCKTFQQQKRNQKAELIPAAIKLVNLRIHLVGICLENIPIYSLWLLLFFDINRQGNACVHFCLSSTKFIVHFNQLDVFMLFHDFQVFCFACVLRMKIEKYGFLL